ncbi:6-phosphofructokinase [Thermoproteus tenax]|uniref:Pyrophosphate--fructose 6-phosphate 1-phosphotransferase n=1 Tax=Thermoproteus tenax (strain ATCC 35583 / DSM 2078 / JCM 9277 / NBRC 100435 / Kra 1) TaxID=768679 RepID=PFP_THETK|nr:6-phosphofructokinase [Thermoproteus tenax]G4RK16.1 RecName: Full=Pyrophosphate--fructose 6-phosphate 1-phosphotransferase; AltName: Full=6-phosphofructokinase, pyrophosphate dependent; AltName: Full=PPi-dependent phosphofructokinase; Short=PPi-PFK; AltName: Full=Pyrophosphate-dependent 6-phosphofructose-1-kinase [Thermoproteus tenax Kra 1]CAA74985.1 alternative product name: pyrophosphate-dependent phosphofructokinase [Thermoproteus tenax Kra 1]CCC81911.1 pyrophosphate-dependent phosphofruct
MKIGVLTGGGDAPGLNIAVYTFVKLAERKHEVYAIYHGWRGLLNKEVKRVSSRDLLDFAFSGGTYIRTSRTNPFKDEERARLLESNVKELGLDVVVAIGGDDTLGAAGEAQRRGILDAVGIPKTIDNDVYGTDYTIGFDSAVNAAIEATESFKTTLISHERIGVVEVMGREAGWIALFTGLSTMADAVLIPERPASWDSVAKRVKEAYNERRWALVVVSEGIKEYGGPKDEYGHSRLGGVGNELAEYIERSTGIEARAVVLGHTIRGVPPTAFDRILAVRYATAAYEAVENGRYGVMVAYSNGDIAYVPIVDVVGKNRLVSGYWMRLYETYWPDLAG